MAVRGSAARRHPDNPLAGVLRDLERRTRAAQRTAGQPGPPGEPGPSGPPGPPGAAAMTTVVTTGPDSRATWILPQPLAAPPVIAAVPAAPAGTPDVALLVVLEEASAARVTVRVWRARAAVAAGQSAVEPAGPGVQVHLTAAGPDAAEPEPGPGPAAAGGLVPSR